MANAPTSPPQRPIQVVPPQGYAVSPPYANSVRVGFIPNGEVSILFLRANAVTEEVIEKAKKDGSLEGEVVSSVTMSWASAQGLLEELAKTLDAVQSLYRLTMTMSPPQNGTKKQGASIGLELSGSSMSLPFVLSSGSVDLGRPATLVACVNASLPVLRAPLTLRYGPLLVSIDHWSDGSVVARLPAARLHAYGSTEAEALSFLGEDIADLVLDLTTGEHAQRRLGGAMLEAWRVLSALVEAPELDGRDRA